MAGDYWWWEAHVLDRPVALAAAPFGYGPRVACERLLAKLNLDHTSWQRTTQPHDAETLLNFGVVDPRCVQRRARCRVWIDCLMWLRSKIPPGVKEHDLCLAEAFFPTRDSLRNRVEIVDIQPLIGVPCIDATRRETDEVLISLGGVQMLHGSEIHHDQWPIQLLNALAGADDAGTNLRVHGPAAAINRWRARTSARVAFSSPTRLEHEELAANAALVVIQPGLYGPFEAFAAYRRVAFTPVFSYTQLGQALALVKHGAKDLDPWTEELVASYGQELLFVFGDEQARFYAHLEQRFSERLATGRLEEQLRSWASLALVSSQTIHREARTRLVNAALAHPHAADVLCAVLRSES